ncbi:pyrimidine operon attenuation protein / uracil phosphoribosyltransferase [Cyclobacterium lianum]|uniref:Pyrimidine operon attenuation protein / uracil phosphoribosyltransferase n=1 Tax=Cyclobacterium lianum TaxID=388280 RepID=A0A1M7PRS5_9BACT|nr:phosphoribosyltransferase family protein [Cyclobacterium lianum]SHN20158.1 pyrimidine operon attenuation protein / uracil phosphoribosyltransferase [Cyclobacterium lianum]
MSETKTLVLNHKQIQQKIVRIAYEIYERNSGEEALVFAGLTGMGQTLAQLIADKLREISPLEVKLIAVTLDKSDPKIGEVTLSDKGPFGRKCIILVDDVLNTGKTLAYAMVPFLEQNVKQIEVAVLVNRSHKLFPVSPDYTGFELATTLSEHIVVDLKPEASTVHLH